MDYLFPLAAHNTAVAFFLAILVYGVTRLWRDPPLAHVLWLLVLLKLVAPPVMRIEWSTWERVASRPVDGLGVAELSRLEVAKGEDQFGSGGRSSARAQNIALVLPETGHPVELGARALRLWERARPLFMWLWIGGTAVWSLVAVVRIARFDRLLQEAPPAPDELQRLAAEVAAKLGVRRTAEVRYLACSGSPFLWCVGRRPTVILPRSYALGTDNQKIALVLAHELAHLRRRDHWVRAVEFLVSTVHWWNPVVWMIRQQIHRAEELCCDAWVRWAYPDAAKRYAEVLLESAELAQTAQLPPRIVFVSPFLNSLSLKARIEMLLESRFAPSASRKALVVAGLCAVLLLPLFVQTTTREAKAVVADGGLARATTKNETSSTSELPNVVKFEQGATRFLDGDKITIQEIRGTADTFSRGNIYWIKGTYTLASHSRATLAAYITAKDAENARSTPLKVQSTTIDKGDGTFTLFLPMTCRGWPHVSFYPAEGGSDFGGNYFGTGESVLKKWWGANDDGLAQPTTKNSTPPASDFRFIVGPGADASDFPFAVKFEQGAKRFLDGDKITIQEIRGTADEFSTDNVYLIKGTYTLTSHSRATLAAYITGGRVPERNRDGEPRRKDHVTAFIKSVNAKNGRGTAHRMNSTIIINKGAGTFTIVLPMTSEGWPHVSFYPAEGGSSFGGNYFGTGDSVLKKMWASPSPEYHDE